MDHVARRAELAAAVWRLVARSGVESVSVRAVAAESGWSPGAVRYYFVTQAELLSFALETMLERVPVRVQEILQTQPPGKARALLVLEQLLPMDEERTVEVLVYLSFVARARTDEALGHVRRSGWTGERAISRLAVLDVTGGDPGATDLFAALPEPLEGLAERLHLLVDGLTLATTMAPEGELPVERASQLLAQELDAVAAAGRGVSPVNR